MDEVGFVSECVFGHGGVWAREAGWHGADVHVIGEVRGSAVDDADDGGIWGRTGFELDHGRGRCLLIVGVCCHAAVCLR